ncbi:MAG: hypothetical protein IBX51_03150 [Marinobacter sp.]|nr:cytochrome c oxidase subunit CcoM [Marinobacter sp.]MBE0485113.1 hypothetical protein [Marinobacter sp.]
MYMDAVVIAGIVTVLLVVGFFVGVGVFIVKDQKAHGGDHTETRHKGYGAKQ